MRKQLIRFGFIFAAVAFAMAWEAGPVAAQGRAPVDVVHAATHDISPPLDKIPAIPPGSGPRTAIPFRPTHPVRRTPPNQPDPLLNYSTSATTLSTTSGQDFLGLGNGLAGFTVQYIPPDTNGAAGDTQFVQWVNASFAVFSKSKGSVVYGPAAGNTLWSGMSGTAGRACSRNNSGDPIAQYDKQANRWVMMQPVFKSPYYLCVAVSTTSDATGSWYRYVFPIPTSLFPDYPKLAVWDDGYYVTYNQFQGNTFAGAAACAMDRSSMLLGNNASMQCFSVNPNYGSLLPADLDGSTTPPSGSPEYFLNYDSNLKSLDLWELQVDFKDSSNSALTGPDNIPVAAFTEACGGGTCIPQANTNQQLDSLGDRLMYRVAYRNFGNGNYESMLVTQSVDTGTSSGNTGIRWYELRETSPSTFPGSNWELYQEGTYAPDSNYRWMPSIAQDKDGDIAMGYSVSSSTMSPTIRYTGRVPGDALGTMESENDILAKIGIAPGSQTNYTRWGDYSSMALDPTNDCTFWYTNEYQPTNGNAWSTRIASFAFPGCSSGTSSPTVSSVNLSSSSVTGGNQLTGNTVTLSGPAPSGGATISFTSSNPTVVPAPADVTVSANKTSTTFTVSANPVTSSANVIITASYNNTSATANLTVNPATSSVAVSSVNLSSSSVTGGNQLTGNTVTLNGPAPSTGATISFTSSNPTAVPAPGDVTVSANNTSTTFTVSTNTVTSSTPVTIAAHYNNTSASANLTVNPASTGGGSFTITATNSSATTTQNGSASYSLTVKPTNGFTGTVTLSVSGVPPQSSGNFSPSSVTFSGTTSQPSTLAVTTGAHTPTKTYTLTITGTDSSGTITASTTVSLAVN